MTVDSAEEGGHPDAAAHVGADAHHGGRGRQRAALAARGAADGAAAVVRVHGAAVDLPTKGVALGRSGACCIKCYKSKRSLESHDFGECYTEIRRIRRILGYKLIRNILYNRPLLTQYRVTLVVKYQSLGKTI